MRAIPALSRESSLQTQDFLVTKPSDLTPHPPLSLTRKPMNNKTFREESSELGTSVWKLGDLGLEAGRTDLKMFLSNYSSLDRPKANNKVII